MSELISELHEKSTERCKERCIDINDDSSSIVKQAEPPRKISTSIDKSFFEYDNRLTIEESESVNSVVVLDWDDTCLPSYFLHNLGEGSSLFHHESLWHDEHWDKLENILLTTISQLKQKYPIYIVTNAENNWVELTCQKFYPKLWHILDGIEIHSARYQYEKEYPAESPKAALNWKSAMLRKISENFNDDFSNEFVGVGDAPHDGEAIKKIAKEKNWNFKNVKFAIMPSVHTLTAQWSLFHYTLPHILWSKGNLDLNMQITIHNDASEKKIPIMSFPPLQLFD